MSTSSFWSDFARGYLRYLGAAVAVMPVAFVFSYLSLRGYGNAFTGTVTILLGMWCANRAWNAVNRKLRSPVESEVKNRLAYALVSQLNFNTGSVHYLENVHLLESIGIREALRPPNGDDLNTESLDVSQTNLVNQLNSSKSYAAA